MGGRAEARPHVEVRPSEEWRVALGMIEVECSGRLQPVEFDAFIRFEERELIFDIPPMGGCS